MAIRRAPDIPYELITFLNGNENHMIYRENTLLKRMFATEMDVHVLDKISNLEIPHYNVHNNVLVDDDYFYLYLVNRYLKPDQYMSLKEAILTLPLKEKLQIIKDILNDLKIAHNQEFNPFDLHHGNFVYGPDYDGKDDKKHPIFIDFDVSYYKTKPTLPIVNGFIADLSPFGIETKDVSIKNLNINDKLLAFHILLTALLSLPKNFNVRITPQLKEEYELLLLEYDFDKAIKERFSSIINEHQTPEEDDYFEDIIDNLENGGIIKKK